MRGRSIRTRPKLPPTPDVSHDEPDLGQGLQLSDFKLQILIRHVLGHLSNPPRTCLSVRLKSGLVRELSLSK